MGYMSAEIGIVWVSKNRDTSIPEVRENSSGLLEFQSKAPAFIAPLTQEEKGAFLDVVSDEEMPIGVSNNIPVTIQSLAARMAAIGANLNSDWQYQDPIYNWYLLDHDVELNNKPHPDNYEKLKLKYKGYSGKAPIVRMTVAATKDNSGTGTVFYPSIYQSIGGPNWVFDIQEQTSGRRNMIITPELTIIGFTGTDVHRSPFFSGLRRGLLSVSLYPKQDLSNLQ